MKKNMIAILLGIITLTILAGCGSSSDNTDEKAATETVEKKVYFYMVRHGETEYNEQGIAQGWVDSPLTQSGVDDAAALGKGLADIDFASVYSSDSGRAIQTAEIAMEERGLKVNTSESLREMNYGDLDGQPSDENFFGKGYTRLNADSGWSDVGGETWSELTSRVLSELDVIAESSKNGDNVFVSTHGMSILGCAENIKDRKGVYQEFLRSGAGSLDNCSVSIFEYKDGDYYLISLNDTSYLEEGRK